MNTRVVYPTVFLSSPSFISMSEVKCPDIKQLCFTVPGFVLDEGSNPNLSTVKSGENQTHARCSVCLLFCARSLLCSLTLLRSFPIFTTCKAPAWRMVPSECWAHPNQGTFFRHSSQTRAHRSANLDNQPLRCCDCVTLVKSVSANHHTSRLHKQHAIECSLPSPLTHNPAETTV